MASLLPKTFQKLVAVSLSQRFQEAVRVESASTPTPGPGQLLIRTKYAGVNASDINWTAGRYIPGIQPPFDTGLEGLGKIVQVGEGCGAYKPGDSVCHMEPGAFGDYVLVPAKRAIPIPKPDPCYVPLMISGMTASIALEKVGQLQEGEKVLVTAAAGGTGQFAVQLAKLAGCHVIGTCSTDEKVAFLRHLGCDRPINYKKESLQDVLKAKYPGGIDVVYESVGGETFNTCVKNLAVRGRLIIIGFITNYQTDSFSSRPSLPIYSILLSKSASIRGFFLNNYNLDKPIHFAKLASLYSSGKLQSSLDFGERCPEGPFRGLESVFRAVEYLYTGKSSGKVIVDLDPETPSQYSKL